MIKFRGKRTDTGEWVYGAYIHNGGRPYIISHEIAEVCDEYFHPAWWCPVVPETVGQYIGIKEQNNSVEIYEGDVARYGCGEYYQGYWEFSGTIIVDITETSQFMDLQSFKILGNIHDNPILREVVR